MNKKTGLVLSTALLFALTGCGTKKEEKETITRTTEEVTVVTEQAAPTDNQDTATRSDQKELMEQQATTEESGS